MHIRPANETDWRTAAQAESVSRGCLGEMPETTDHVYVLEHEGAYLGLCGLKQMNPTCAWAWMDLAREALQYKKSLFATVSAFLDGLMEEVGLTRLMAAVELDFPEALTFATHLGFHRESRMASWTGDRPALMMVRLRKRGD